MGGEERKKKRLTLRTWNDFSHASVTKFSVPRRSSRNGTSPVISPSAQNGANSWLLNLLIPKPDRVQKLQRGQKEKKKSRKKAIRTKKRETKTKKQEISFLFLK